MPRRRPPLGAILFTLLFTCSCESLLEPDPSPGVLVAPRALRPASDGDGKIAFLRYNFEDDPGIYTMNADGSGRTRVPNTPGAAQNAALSPDGTRILFLFTGEGLDPGIYVINIDGTGRTGITDGNAQSPTWSPDGTKIAYSKFLPASNGLMRDVIVVIDSDDGENQIEITGETPSTHHSQMPSWSPDGTKMAFIRRICVIGCASGQVYVIDLETGDETQLTNLAGVFHWSPAWSPDGTKIAFIRDDDVYVMNATGSDPTNLTNSAAEEFYAPAWSPNGAKIAFNRHTGGYNQIFVMNANGTSPTNISNASENHEFPSWGPPLDADGDGVSDEHDNCPDDANADQTDTDGDGLGDACDPDADGDGYSNADEIAAGSDPYDAASTPEVCDGVDNDLDGSVDEGFTDTDGDGFADCFDPDDDGDGIYDSVDSAPLVASAHFSDVGLGGATAGTITSIPANTAVAVRDTAPGGVKVVVTATGVVAGGARVQIELDGKKSTIKLAVPGTYVVTDPVDDVTVAVTVAGPAEIELVLNGSPIVIAIAEGASATVTETTDSSGNLTGVGVSNVTGDSGDVTVNGQTVPPGETWNPPTGPTSKGQCRKGGWRAFGFANEGQCTQSLSSGKPGKKS